MPRKFKPEVETPDQNTPVPGAGYGQRQAQEQAMEQAPPNDPQARMARLRQAAQQTDFQPVGMGAPTSSERSRFPETAGLPFGRGPGPEANRVMVPRRPEDVTEEQQQAARLLPLIQRLADQQGSSATIKRLARSLRAQSVASSKGKF